MSEGYVFSSATDVNDLLNQVVSQAALHGWTQNELSTHESLGRRGHISKDGVTINLCSMPAPLVMTSGETNLDLVIPIEDRSPEGYVWAYYIGAPVNSYYGPDVLCINAGTGYSGGSPWYRQPGAEVMPGDSNQGRFSVLRAKGAIGKVHMFFFDAPSAIYVFAEARAGEWYWLAGGNLNKDYEYAGGQFYGASMPDTDIVYAYPRGFADMRHRVTETGAAVVRGNGWGATYQTSPYNAVGAYTHVPDGESLPGYHIGTIGGGLPNGSYPSQVQFRGYDSATGRLWIQPPYTYVGREGGGSSYLGVLPHVHYSTLEAFVGGEVVSIGGQEYMVLPFNWRISPWDFDVAETAADYLCWARNNTHGAGVALRKPS